MKCKKCGDIHPESINCQAELILQEKKVNLNFNCYESLSSDFSHINQEALSKVHIKKKEKI